MPNCTGSSAQQNHNRGWGASIHQNFVLLSSAHGTDASLGAPKNSLSEDSESSRDLVEGNIKYIQNVGRDNANCAHVSCHLQEHYTRRSLSGVTPRINEYEKLIMFMNDREQSNGRVFYSDREARTQFISHCIYL
jgi:hypothetical protein